MYPLLKVRQVGLIARDRRLCVLELHVAVGTGTAQVGKRRIGDSIAIKLSMRKRPRFHVSTLLRQVSGMSESYQVRLWTEMADTARAVAKTVRNPDLKLWILLVAARYLV